MSDFVQDIYSFLSKNTQNNLEIEQINYQKAIIIPNLHIIIHCVKLMPVYDNLPNYFLNLSKDAHQKGFRLIHLWEDQWHSKTDIIKARLLSLLQKSDTISARLTQVQRIDKPTLNLFLAQNHLNVTTNTKFKYGLYLPKRYFRILENPKNQFSEQVIQHQLDTEHLLVAVASFSSAKTIIRDKTPFRSYELIRFANLKGFNVVGGFDKLLKAFCKEQNPDDIMTYVDRDWSDGHSYQKLGFEMVDETPPMLIWIDSETHERFYPNKISETDIDTNKYIKCWNTGNLKFIKRFRCEMLVKK